MPAYLTLFNWTEQGVRNVKDTAKRAQAAREAWEAAGGRFIGIWWTFGGLQLCRVEVKLSGFKVRILAQ